MSLRKLNSMLMIAAIALAAVSCKDDEEEVEVVYVNGSLRFELPEFILPNETVTIVPKGLSHPDGGEIGYCWKVTPSMSTYDTTRFENGLDAAGDPTEGIFIHSFPDSLKTYTVYCYGFASGYASSSYNLKTTVVSPGPEKSITNTGIKFFDPNVEIDGIRHYYTTIGGKDWLRQDLAYTEKGVPFRNGKAMNGVFGLYYSYEEALEACPEGWTLPTDEDWTNLGKALNGNTGSDNPYSTIPGVAAKLMADAYFNGIRMWEYWPSVGKITNESKMSMIPSGYALLGEQDSNGNYTQARFKGVYEYSVYWTADKVADEEGMAYYRYIYCDQPDMMIGKGDTKTFGAAVRCVRDSVNNN